jgi:hypothetical protein
MLTKIAIAAFSDELRRIQVADADTPLDYLETRAAVMAKLGMYLPQMLRRGADAVKPHAGHLTELAGLGILAKPSIDELRGKKVDEKKKARTEVAGLGVLAAPSAYSLGKHLLTRH